MNETTEDLQAKLLAILNQPEDNDNLVESIQKTASGDEEQLSSNQRATLQTLLDAGLPTPEEIVRDAEIAERNAAIERRRQEDLAKRQERRVKQGKLKKHRRR